MGKKNLGIVITGGSSGIGEASAIALAEGNRVFLIGRDQDRLTKVAKKVESNGGTAYTCVCNVGDTNDVEQAFVQIDNDLGQIDILFTNAGVGYFGYLEDMTTEQFDIQFNTNVRGVFLFLRKALPGMKNRNTGQIIVTSSNLGLETSGRASIYSATKHAVQAMIECLRAELLDTGVKAATINPGSVSTPWYDGKNVDRSKMLTAEDVARTVRFIVDQSQSSDIDHVLLYPRK